MLISFNIQIWKLYGKTHEEENFTNFNVVNKKAFLKPLILFYDLLLTWNMIDEFQFLQQCSQDEWKLLDWIISLLIKYFISNKYKHYNFHFRHVLQAFWKKSSRYIFLWQKAAKRVKLYIWEQKLKTTVVIFFKEKLLITMIWCGLLVWIWFSDLYNCWFL